MTTAVEDRPRLGLRRRAGGSLVFLGPAFVAGIAYVDPGNFATNLEAGSSFGYRLLWVVLAANLVAALMQYLSAKLGLASGRDLAQVSRVRLRRPVVIALWLQAEVVAMATDLAEVVGGALALNLLLGLPLPAGALVTAGCAYALLLVQRRGYRPFELAVLALFVLIAAGVCVDVALAHPSAGAAASGLLPGFAGTDSVVLATAIVGATVMPHAIYLHSALVRRSPELTTRRALRLQRLDIGAAMSAAGLVNLGMLVLAAATLTGVTGGIPGFHAELGRTIGGLGAFFLVVALLASGLASSGVGTLAGEVIMAGYLERRVPRWVRRTVTLAPGLLVLCAGTSATTALVMSQFVLGLGIPFTLVPLILATRDRTVMGAMVNRRATTVLAWLCAAVVTAVALYSLVALLW